MLSFAVDPTSGFSDLCRTFKNLKYRTALTSLDLSKKDLGYSEFDPYGSRCQRNPEISARLCRGLKYLTALTYLNLRESNVDLSRVCKTLKYLKASTHLNVCRETRTADDAARVCHAAAAAGSTRLKRLLLGESLIVYGMCNSGEYDVSDIVECETWKQLKFCRSCLKKSLNKSADL